MRILCTREGPRKHSACITTRVGLSSLTCHIILPSDAVARRDPASCGIRITPATQAKARSIWTSPISVNSSEFICGLHKSRQSRTSSIFRVTCVCRVPIANYVTRQFSGDWHSSSLCRVQRATYLYQLYTTSVRSESTSYSIILREK